MEPLQYTPRPDRPAADAATEKEVMEYQRLLAERFAVDPSLPRQPGDEAVAKRERRLRELAQKLGFVPAPARR